MEIGTDSYKGVRDFYPEEMFIQKYIFTKMREVVEKYGYVEYGASVLEPTELYKAKSGEEIVNDQTYSFKDRGDRDVTLRPEMTPTVARMVAAKRRELAFPLRWYSIPNLFRYEKPQRGRLREHWQLNVDVFGVTTINAEVEIMTIAYRLMESFGALRTDFELKVNSRKTLDFVLKEIYKLSDKNAYALTKLIDRKNKIEAAEFLSEAKKILKDKTEEFITLLSFRNPVEFKKFAEDKHNSDVAGIDDIIALQSALNNVGISTTFDPTLARGFDYYTGIVFEVFDTNSENRRALFGGGRYDDLLSVFGSDKVPAVGFGMGDVTIRDFLEVRNLLPKYAPTARVSISPVNETNIPDAMRLADELRTQGINVAIDVSGKKLGDQIKGAVKQSIPFVLVVGDDEVASGIFPLKELASGKEEKVARKDIAGHITK